MRYAEAHGFLWALGEVVQQYNLTMTGGPACIRAACSHTGCLPLYLAGWHPSAKPLPKRPRKPRRCTHQLRRRGVAASARQQTLPPADSALSATSLLASGITLINARPFNSTGSVTATFTVSLSLPANGYVPMALLIKTARPDGDALFNVGITAPAEATGPVDDSVWFRAATLSIGTGADTAVLYANDPAGAGVQLGVVRRQLRQATAKATQRVPRALGRQ